MFLMNLSGLILLNWALTLQASASNHFAGLVASNSASTSSYTCRTQAQVCRHIQLLIYDVYMFDNVVEHSRC